MARVACGDHEAFRELVLRHQDRVFALARRYLADAADAEEIAQETFVRLFRAAPRYRPEAAFRSYLLKIAANLCANRSARAYRRQELRTDPADLDASHCARADLDPEKRALAAERADAVRAAVLDLPDDQRMALLLFRFEGLSYEEIGELTGKSVSSVTSALWRARAALRQSLRGWAGRPALQDRRPSPVNADRPEGSEG